MPPYRQIGAPDQFPICVMIYCVLEQPGDLAVHVTSGAAASRDGLVLLDPALLDEVPGDWDRGKIILPEALCAPERLAPLVDLRSSAFAALVPRQRRAAFAPVLATIRLFLARQWLVEAIAGLPAEKRFVASAASKNRLLIDLTRPGAHFMGLLPGFRPILADETAQRPSRLRARAEERFHPGVAILRDWARRSGTVLEHPEGLAGPMPDLLPFPAGRLRHGVWPDLEISCDRDAEPAIAAAPTLDVIVPVHNAAATIVATADAILAGLDPADRLIMVENGSSDASWDVIHSRYGAHPCVVLDRLRHPDPADARNRAIARGRGDYVAFCDADDLWHPCKPRLVKEVLRRTDADLLLHPSLTIRDGEVRLEGAGLSARALPRYGTLLADLLVFNNFIATSSVVLRRASLPLPLFSPGLARSQDYEAWCRWSVHNPRMRFAWLDEPLAYYRRHALGISANAGARLVKGSEIVRRYSRHLDWRVRWHARLRNVVRILWRSLRLRRPWRIIVAALIKTPPATIRDEAVVS